MNRALKTNLADDKSDRVRREQALTQLFPLRRFCIPKVVHALNTIRPLRVENLPVNVIEPTGLLEELWLEPSTTINNDHRCSEPNFDLEQFTIGLLIILCWGRGGLFP